MTFFTIFLRLPIVFGVFSLFRIFDRTPFVLILALTFCVRIKAVPVFWIFPFERSINTRLF